MRTKSRLLSLFATLGLTIGLGSGRAPAQAPAAGSAHARLWQAYRARFLSPDGRIIDPQGNDRTTSEGQSYALFFALVNNDRAHFDQILEWTRANLAAGDLTTRLPAWSWGQSKDGHWGVLDANSASDSDLWIAYDLVEAGRLWHEPHYTEMGRRLASLAGKMEAANLPGFGAALLPGSSGFKFPKAWVLNPSYTPVFVLVRLASLDPTGPWYGIAANVPALLERSQRGGFAMDWVSYTPGAGFTPCLANNSKTVAAVGSYDAIRVYLWAGMLDDSSLIKARLLRALPGMNAYMSQHSAPPEKIGSQGNPLGGDGPVGFSAALLPYLQGNANSGAVAQQQVRIQSQLDEKSNLYGNSPTYYDQNLLLFGSGWMESRFRFGSSGELLVPWTHP
jgi:endoglucanase